MRIKDYYLFEVPVYSCRTSEHYKKCNDKAIKDLNNFYELNSDIPRSKAPESYHNFEKYVKEKYVTPWNYNEIIGFIRIYKLGNQIRGETWFVSAKRIQHKMKNKMFRLFGDTFEITCYQNDSSQDIFKEIMKALLGASKVTPFHKRYIDFSSFMNCGPFIDWKGIVEI